GWGSRVDPPAAAVRGHASSSRPGLDRRAALFARSARRGPTTPPARAPPPLRVGLDRAPYRRPGLRVPQLRRGMSARAAAFAGLRVVLVAAFNPRYHRSGRALARALTELGCEVRPCEERLRGLNAVLRRPLATRLGALAGAPCVRGITRPRARAGRPGARRAGPGRVGPGVAERARVRRRLRAGALESHRRPEHPPAFRGGGRPSPLR